MNPLMLAKKQEQLQRELEDIQRITTAPLRYLEYVKKQGTALGKTYRQKLKAA